MECIFAFILELFLEVGTEACKSNKLSKHIRYPLTVIIVLFYIAVLGFAFWVGISSLLEEKISFGIFFILIGLIGLFPFVENIIMFKKTYLKDRM